MGAPWANWDEARVPKIMHKHLVHALAPMRRKERTTEMIEPFRSVKVNDRGSLVAQDIVATVG